MKAIAKISLSRMVILFLVLAAVLTAAWLGGGRRWLEQYLMSISYEEHTFVIPAKAEALSGVTLSAAQRGIQLCNKTVNRLSLVTIRVNKTYIANVGPVLPDDCKHIPLQEFHGDTWKKIPAGPDMRVEVIESLSTVERTYYSQQVYR